MKRTLCLTAAVVGLAACSTPQPGTPAFTAMAAQMQHDAKVEQVKASSSEVPDWYGQPQNEDRYLMASGTAVSADMQFSIDKAVLAAKRSIADQLNSRISAKIKEFISENGDVQQGIVSERTTINTVNEVTLAGYNVVQKKIVPTGTQYRSYVLVQYPLDTTSRTPVNQARLDVTPTDQAAATKAFEALSHEVATTPAAKPDTVATVAKPEAAPTVTAPETAAVPATAAAVPSEFTAPPAISESSKDQPPAPAAAPRDKVDSNLM